MTRPAFPPLLALLALGWALVAPPGAMAGSWPEFSRTPLPLLRTALLSPSVPGRTAAVADEPLPRKLDRHLREAGAWAPLAFVALYILTCVLCLPTLVLAVAAGALWGVGLGLVYVWIGLVLGSGTAFLIGRHLARDWVQRRLAGHPRLEAIEEAVSAEGWKIVVLARLSPGSPFFLLNYLFGLTRIGFWEHLVATAFSALPGALLLVVLGAAGEMALDGRRRTPWDWALFGIGLVALAAGVALVSRRARRILDAKLRRPTDTPLDPPPP